MNTNGFLLFVLVLVTPFVLCKAEDDSSSSSSSSSDSSSSTDINEVSPGSDQSDGNITEEEHLPMEPSNKRYHISSVPESLTLEPALAIQIKPFLDQFARPFAFSPIADKFDAIIDKDNANAINIAFYSMYTILKDELAKFKEKIKTDQIEYTAKIEDPIDLLEKSRNFIFAINNKLEKKYNDFDTQMFIVANYLENLIQKVNEIRQTYETQVSTLVEMYEKYQTTIRSKREAVIALIAEKKTVIEQLMGETAEKSHQVANSLKLRQIEEMSENTSMNDFNTNSNFDDDEDSDNLSEFALSEERE